MAGLNADFCGYDARLATRNAWSLSVAPTVGDIDIAVCKECGGTVKVIPKAFAVLTWQALASIEDPAVIKQVLAHLQRKVESKEFNPFSEAGANC